MDTISDHENVRAAKQEMHFQVFRNMSCSIYETQAHVDSLVRAVKICAQIEALISQPVHTKRRRCTQEVPKE